MVDAAGRDVTVVRHAEPLLTRGPRSGYHVAQWGLAANGRQERDAGQRVHPDVSQVVYQDGRSGL